ncbi:hypothetical protein E4U32_006514 [Claviceps aff. humidiphila group G2b]|nr:hypothetical protein E4U32_006514 [Claviceps aff. humidiphila group G2b]
MGWSMAEYGHDAPYVMSRLRKSCEPVSSIVAHDADIYVRRCLSIGLRGGISVHGIAGPDNVVRTVVVGTELIDGAGPRAKPPESWWLD